ncbi:hypothetical protein [Rhodovibrio salinarum]|uniref:hypothetical protein n=1 Tax=Rhodovibrio salinarum TaxID=1087 RepID=UPI0019079DE3|nr:hypothetical protein [Rhodovibrio salinarum]
MTRSVRPLATAVLLAAVALPEAAEAAGEPAPTPLYTHTDTGPVTVMHGDTGTPLPLENAAQSVRSYLADVDALLGRGGDAPVATIEEAIDRGRTLQDSDLQLVGTLYVEEALRRLTRMRLARIPVESTQVHATYAKDYAARFAKPVVLRRGVDDLGINYATLAACLEMAEIPKTSPPHKVRVEPDGALWTRLNGTPLALDLVPFQGERMLLRSIVLGTSRSLGFKDKAQVTRMLLESCI